MSALAGEIAERVDGYLTGEAGAMAVRLAHFMDARPHALSWYRGDIPEGTPGIVIGRGAPHLPPPRSAYIECERPRLAFALAYNEWFLGHPKGEVTTLSDMPSEVLEGQGCEWDGQRWVDMPQVGSLYIGPNVRFGSGTKVMRGSLGSTVIGLGCRIGHNVQIGHNVRVGEHCLIASGALLCGSCTVGDRVRIGAGALIRERVLIGEDAVIGMGAVVVSDVPAGATFCGVPAREVA